MIKKLLMYARQTSGNVKTRNGVLAAALRSTGFRSVNHACDVAGVSSTVVGEILNGRTPLINKFGRVVHAAAAFAEVLGETPERLFESDIMVYRVLHRRVQPKVYDDSIAVINTLLKALSPRERTVISGYFIQQRSLDDIANQLNITRAGADFVLKRALRKLRAPARRYLLAEIV